MGQGDQLLLLAANMTYRFVAGLLFAAVVSSCVCVATPPASQDAISVDHYRKKHVADCNRNRTSTGLLGVVGIVGSTAAGSSAAVAIGSGSDGSKNAGEIVALVGGAIAAVAISVAKYNGDLFEKDHCDEWLGWATSGYPATEPKGASPPVTGRRDVVQP